MCLFTQLAVFSFSVSHKSFCCLAHRAATANTRWIRAGRRPIPSSTTTSATPPITTLGGGSRRVSLARQRMATPSPSPWWSRSHGRTRHPCPRCPLSSPRAPRPLSYSARARAPCSGRREAGLPHPPCFPPNPPANTAPSTGPRAAWAVLHRPLPLASPLLFDTQFSFQ